MPRYFHQFQQMVQLAKQSMGIVFHGAPKRSAETYVKA
jgi:hypothetical protein